METSAVLTEVNLRICDAERQRDAAFLASVLTDDLIFRRASGARVRKDEYLADLLNEANRYDYLHCDEVEVITHGPDSALVSLLVWAKGVRGDDRFRGVFRNTRLFVNKGGQWMCAIWFNTRMEAP